MEKLEKKYKELTNLVNEIGVIIEELKKPVIVSKDSSEPKGLILFSKTHLFNGFKR